jgi:hypothetical protein
MKIFTVLIFALAFIAPAALAQNYPLVPIDTIQWVPVGHDSSYYAGDTVVTGGLVVAGTGCYYAGTGVTFYMENPAGGPFSGIMAYNPQREGFPELVPGDSILCTALVSEYVSTGPPYVVMTELFIVPGSFQYRMYGMPEPAATEIPASMIDSTAHADSAGEQYEGVFVKVAGLTVDTVINYTTTSTWVCHDSTGAHCVVREASDSIPNSFRPPVGTYFDFVQGVLYHRFGAYQLQPRYMRDIRLGRGAAIVTSTHRPTFPLVNEPVTITANVVDDEPMPQDSIRLYYRINLGAWLNVPMTHQAGETYTFTLPSPVAGWKVDYYVHAVDDSNNVTNDPYEAPFGFYEYSVQQARAMTIAQARVDANADFIPDMLDSAVIVTGIAVSPSFSSTSYTDFFMQQGNAGISVYYDSTLIMVNPGDSITVNGIVDHYYGRTRVRIYHSNRLTNNGPGHHLDTLAVTVADLADINGEPFEGRLVKVSNVDILGIPNPWPTLGLSATMTIAAGADSADLRIDRSTDIDGQPQVGPRANIVGVVGQYDTRDPYNAYYQLMPRYYADFTWLQGIDDNSPLPLSYSLEQNYPNPFNPSTNISFSLKVNSHIILSIYNLMGQKVTTLVNQELAAGTHSVTWKGVDSRGENVTSGMYFYRIETDNFTATKKMVLLK